MHECDNGIIESITTSNSYKHIFSVQVFIQFASKQSENDEDTKSKEDIGINDKTDIPLPPLKEAEKTKTQYNVDDSSNPMEETFNSSRDPNETHTEFVNPMIFGDKSKDTVYTSSMEEGQVELVSYSRKKSSTDNINDAIPLEV